MLTRIDLIRNVGRFEELKQEAPELGQLALIHARNAYGKSTICAVLRSAATVNTDAITERKRLGTSTPLTIATSWDDAGTVSFTAGAWNKKSPRLLVFDSEFVRRNIHVGEEVTRDNMRSLLRVIVGAPGVSLAQSINKADDDINVINRDVTEKDRLIRTSHPAVRSVSAFCAKSIPSDLDEQVLEARRKLAGAQLGDDVRLKAAPSLINLGIASTREVINVLDQVIDGSSPALESLVEDHISSHGLAPQAHRWLRYGTERIVENECPFCAQDLSSSQIAKSLVAYFSEALKALTEELDIIHGSVSALLDEKSGLAAKIRLNNQLFDFWNSAANVGAHPLPDDAWSTEATLGLRSLLQAIEAKRAKPLDAAPLLDPLAVGLSIEAINRYDTGLTSPLAIIAATKANPSTSNVFALKATLDELLASVARRDGPLGQIVIDRTKLEADKADAVERKGADKALLNTHMVSTAQAHEDRINDLLELFGTNFRLCKTKASYVGREPNSEYCIEVGGHRIKAGANPKSPEPTFRTLLSAGDKSTLALAFFISAVLSDPKISETVVAFDDPFSSQDHFRQAETARQIRIVSSVAKQTLVFSHDLRFIKQIYDDADQTRATVHHILFKAPAYASLRTCDLEKELSTLYVRRADRIRLYAKTGTAPKDCTLTEIQTDLRTFMEEYVYLRNPGRFSPNMMLNAMIGEIETTGVSDPLYEKCAYLRAINEYSRVDHHKSAPIPDPDQLKAKCAMVVKIIGSY